MRKILTVSFGLIALFVLLIVGIYFLFPETMFKLAVKAERHSAGLIKKEIQVDDHKIVYLEGGKGQTILLLHGFGADKDNWTRFAKYFTGDYHLVITSETVAAFALYTVLIAQFTNPVIDAIKTMVS